MEVPEHHLDNWKHFKDFIYDDIFVATGVSRGDCYFRGQSNSHWSLTATLDRKYGTLPNWVEVEQALLSEFGRRCQNIPALEEVLTHPYRALALAQHHGLPTRLLDWSDSPYVAAYFAFEGALEKLALDEMHENDRVAIWIVNAGAEIWQIQDEADQYEGVKFWDVPAWRNERMHNQCGFFSVNNSPQDSVDEFVRQAPGSGGALAKYTIPASEVVKALQDLDLMEISADRLFTTVEGKAKTAETRVLLELLKA